jgi:hypothetical protein
MKKLSILFAAVALMAMTACNEKPAKTTDDANKAPAATEQVDTAKQAQPKVNVEHAKPTEDGKDHTVAEFNTKEYQVRLENLADGTFRLSLWDTGKDKSGEPKEKIETKNCVMQGGNYLMKSNDGKMYIIKAKAGAEQITIMTNKAIEYNGNASK